MPEVNLSTLRDRELRQLLDSARQRGQASLSYMILQEMEARRTHGRREKPARRPAGPRIAAVDLGDALEEVDDASPMAGPDAPAEPHGEPPAEAPDEPPLRFARTRPPPPERPRSRSGWGALLFACGLALGLAGGWKAAEYAYGPRLAKVAAAEPPAAPPQAAAQPAATPAIPPAVVPEAAAAVPEAPPPDTAAPSPQVAEAAPEAPPPPPAEADEQPQAPAAEEGRSAQPEAIRCSSEPTPADQAICRSPRLQRLQRDLRRAYAAALEAHEDRALLRERQLAWADARDAVGDPERLAQLYEERIRKLNAATAEALRER